MKSDSDLQSEVITALKWEPHVHQEDIGVSVSEGVVMLDGYVRCEAEKHIAERAATSVVGVRAIDDEIHVRRKCDRRAADLKLTRQIEKAFAGNILIPRDQVRVAVDKGWVTLSGVVDYWFQIAETARVARKSPHALGVINDLSIRPPMRHLEE